MPKVNTQWFRGIMRDRKITNASLGAPLHLDPSAVSRRIHGILEWSPDELVGAARVLGVPLEELLRNVGVDAGDVVGAKEKVAVVGWVDEKGNVRHGGGLRGSRRVSEPPQMSKHAEALRIQAPGAMSGAVVYYEPQKEIPSDAIGRWCVIGLHDEKVVLGVLDRGYSRGLFKVTTLSGELIGDGLWVEWAAPVAWCQF